MLDKRYKTLFVTVFILLSILLGKIEYYKIYKSEEYTKAIDIQSTKVKEISKERKPIFDRNHIPLTDRSIANLNFTKSGEFSKSNENKHKSFTVFNRYEKNFPASHIIGYTSKDGTGLSGIEKKYNSMLTTDSFKSVVYKADAIGRPLKNGFFYPVNTSPLSEGLTLTIDYHIQKIADEVMDEYIKKGCVVILDTQTFEILAISSRPDYDITSSDIFSEKKDSPLLNRALCAYNAGSIYKTITAAAILEKDFNYLGSSYNCEGEFKNELLKDTTHTFHCHSIQGHGLQTFSDGFANSCNCTFFEAALKTGGENIVEIAKKFGFGKKVLDFGDEEAKGNLMEKDIYSPSDILNMSIGQGEILVTPLQCAVMMATVANGGEKKDVTIIKGESDCHSGKNVISKATSDALSIMMRKCVLTGTGKNAGDSGAEIAGKTGSAETGWKNENGEYCVHGWFAGFFPYSNPKYAMAVFYEDGKSGAGSCVEPFTKIAEKILQFYPIKQ